MAGLYAPPALLLMGGGIQATPPDPPPPMMGYPPWALLLMQGGIAGGVVPPVDLPATFAGAVLARLKSSSKIMVALEGGLWHREAPAKRPGKAFPFAVYSLINEKADPFTNHGDITNTGLLRFAVSSKSQDTARRIAEKMVLRVASADLLFDAGWLMELRPENPTTTGRPERAPGGAWCWTEIRAMYFEYTSRIPYPGQPDDLP